MQLVIPSAPVAAQLSRAEIRTSVTPVVIAVASPGLLLYPVPRVDREVPARVEQEARRQAELVLPSVQVVRVARLL